MKQSQDIQKKTEVESYGKPLYSVNYALTQKLEPSLMLLKEKYVSLQLKKGEKGKLSLKEEAKMESYEIAITLLEMQMEKLA